MRTMQSEYMHWAKNQRPVRFPLGSSEVAHFRLDRFPIDVADLELDGASYYRYPPLRQAIADKEGVTPGPGGDGRTARRWPTCSLWPR